MGKVSGRGAPRTPVRFSLQAGRLGIAFRAAGALSRGGDLCSVPAGGPEKPAHLQLSSCPLPAVGSTCPPRFGEGAGGSGGRPLPRLSPLVLRVLPPPGPSLPTPRCLAGALSLTSAPRSPPRRSQIPSQPPLRPGEVEFHFVTRVPREGQRRACSVAAARRGWAGAALAPARPGSRAGAESTPPPPRPQGVRRPRVAAREHLGPTLLRPSPAASHSASPPPLRGRRSWFTFLSEPHTALQSPAEDLGMNPGDQRTFGSGSF